MKKVSIIIVTHNSEDDIFDCVNSIKRCADIPLDEIELIIIDNKSNESQLMFHKLSALWGDDIVIIENTHNGGYGQGNNVGIRRSTAPILLIMNPDVRLIDPIFKIPLAEFNKNEKLIMYGMKQMYTPIIPSVNSFWCTTLMNGYARTLITGLFVRFDIFLPRYMYFSGSCFYIRKSMFQAVGLFDEDVFMYGEEDDIHYRLMKKYGTNFKYNKSIHYIHLMMGRESDIKYETKLLDVDLFLHAKKGIPREQTIRTHLQKNTTLLAKAHLLRLIGKGNEQNFKMLKAFREVIKSKMLNS